MGVRAAPDGYTFTVMGSSYAVNRSFYKLSFDPINDITPIAQISQGPFIVVLHPGVAARTVKDFIALAKAKSGQLSYATSGAGSITHLSTELFLGMAGVKMIHVPYKGTGSALVDTIAGQVALIDDPGVVRRILEHLERSAPEPAERGPPAQAPNWPASALIAVT